MKILSLILMSLSFCTMAERFSVPEQDNDWQRHGRTHTYTQDNVVHSDGQNYNVDKTTTLNGNGTKSTITSVTNQSNHKSYTYQDTTNANYSNHKIHTTNTKTVTNNQNNHSYTYQGQSQKNYTNGSVYSHQTGVVTNNQTGKSYNLNDTEVHTTTNTNSTVTVSPTNSTTVVVQQQPQVVYYPSYYYSPMVTPMMVGVPIYAATANQNNINSSNYVQQNGQNKVESGSYESALSSYMH